MAKKPVDEKKQQSKLRRFRKNLRREICIFAGVQLSLLLLIIPLFDGISAVPLEETKTTEIVVEKIDLERFSLRRINAKSVALYDASENRFLFDDTPGENGYTLDELLDSVHPGETLTLIYTEKANLFGVINRWILDARSTKDVYRYFEEEAGFQWASFTASCTLAGIVELIFLSVIVLFYYFKYKWA